MSLGLAGSEWAEPEFNSLEYDKLRSAVLNSAAATKIIILDCCFSGRVVSETMADPVTEMVGQIDVDGTYVLASAGRDQVALIQPGEDYTAFTGRFLHMLRDGVPGGPKLLTVDYLYRRLVIKMKAEGLPQPQKRGTSTADLLALAGNRAFGAAGQHLQQATGKPLRTLPHDSRVSGVAFSPDGRLLATASGDGMTRLLDPATGERLRTLAQGDAIWGHGNAVWGVTFSADGRLLATASGGMLSGTACLWDPATGERLRTLDHGNAVWGVAFRPDGRLLTTAGGSSFGGTACLWDPATGKPLRTLAHDSRVSGVAFSPDGRLLATASADKAARLLDTWWDSTGEPLRTLAHDSRVSGAAFSPDGRLLATASEDKAARLWDPATGDCLRTLTGHADGVSAVAFSPDGRLLATASADKTARLWTVPSLKTYQSTLIGDGRVRGKFSGAAGGWLAGVVVCGRGGRGRCGLFPGFGVSRAGLAVRGAAGRRGWEGGGGLPVTPAYLWDRSPYQSLVAGT